MVVCGACRVLILVVLLWRHTCEAVCAITPDSNGHVDIPLGNTTIAAGAFFDCLQLKSVNIYSSVATIGDQAFDSCTYLVTVNIVSAVVRSIGNNAFANCARLKVLELPYSVLSIGDRAFWGCVSLEQLSIPSTVEVVGPDLFQWENRLSKIGQGVGHLMPVYDPATGLKTLTVPGTPEFENITAGSFDHSICEHEINSADDDDGTQDDDDGWGDDDDRGDCQNCGRRLSELPPPCQYDHLIIEEGVKTIQYRAFHLTNFKTVSLPDSLESIGAYAFWKNEHLTTLTTNKVKKICKGAFRSCDKLAEIDLTGVEELGESAFRNSAKFGSSVTLGTSLKKIGAGAFAVGKMMSVTPLPATAEQKTGRVIILPESLVEIGKAAFTLNMFALSVQVNSANTLKVGEAPFTMFFSMKTESIQYRKGLRLSNTSSPRLGNVLLDSNGKDGLCACKGGYGSDLGVDSDYFNCVPCAAGSSSTTPLSMECAVCPVGTFSTEPGATTCSPCPPGRSGLFEEGTSLEMACVICLHGTYSSAEGATKCSPCPPGSYCDDEGTAYYKGCAAGKYNGKSGRSEDCHDCPAGRYQSEKGSASCDLCEKGKYNVDKGMNTRESCSPCQAGKYASQAGAASCTVCEIGKLNNEEGLSVCYPCPAGFTTSGAGYTICDKRQFISCPSGQIRDEESDKCESCGLGRFPFSARECEDCPLGSYSASVNDTKCTLCPVGKFSQQEKAVSSSSCSSCEKGMYAPSEGASECLPCPPGSFCGENAMSEYQECSVGNYQDKKEEKVGCKACPPGRYQSTDGSATCALCPSGTHNPLVGQAHNASCSPCSPGSYSNQEGASDCTSCPEGSFQESAGQVQCLVCSEYYNDPLLTSDGSRLGCVLNRALAVDTLQGAMVESGLFWLLIVIVTLLFMGVGTFIHFKRERYDDGNSRPEAETELDTRSRGRRMMRIEAAWKSFVPGYHLISELFLVAFLFKSVSSSKGARVGGALIFFRLLHLAASTMFFTTLFSPKKVMARVGLHRVIPSARMLFKNIDGGFARENAPVFGALLVLALTDVTLIQFWPWKEFVTGIRFVEFYPSRDVANVCLVVELIHSVASIFCLGFGLACVENDEYAKIYYANIVPLFAVTIIVTIFRLVDSARAIYVAASASVPRETEVDNEHFEMHAVYDGKNNDELAAEGPFDAAVINPLREDHALRREIEESSEEIEQLEEEARMLDEDLLSLELRRGESSSRVDADALL